MFIPAHSDLFEPTLNALKALGGSGNNQEIYDKVCELENFSEEQQSVLHKEGPQTEISYRLAWAKSYLKIYGVIESVRRGVWSLSEKGRNLKSIDPKKVQRFVQSNARQKRQDNSSNNLDNSLEEKALIQEEEESLDLIDKSLQMSVESDIWVEKLLQVLQKLSPDAFERLCQRLLRESGFVKVEVTGKKGDGGIDGIGVLKIGLLSFQVFFQCKRYSGSVGSSEIRDFRGAMVGRTDKGLFLTTGTFTRSAQQEATRDGAPAIDLIDGEQLCQLLKDLKLGIETKTIEVIEINQTWFAKL
ncbi:restriction endonuclease family protein [Lyngbya aestuarii BL J]|uniref:Restriction endonuclease family protein n=1 Tax=Lyngbya aestuarii BL J TaxID=1348334 RepID=U7QGN4_9CYAN|nr:restriction endonuclease [Lyngbya aestuarii]ERT06245.1 restriction endonuclease family protein [Lyngbya aestuarii BL J]